MRISMKLLTAILAAAILLTSCSRDHINGTDTQSESEPRLVIFGVSSATQSVSPMRAATGDKVKLQSTKLQKFAYVVLKKTSVGYIRVGQPSQTFLRAEESLPESISFMLHKGDYRIVAYALGETEKKGGIGSIDQAQSLNFDVNSAESNHTTYATGYAMNSDVFFAAADFTVNESLTSQTLILKRIVGRLDIEFVNGFTPETTTVELTTMKYTYAYSYSYANIASPLLNKSANNFTLPIKVSDMKTSAGGHPAISLYFFGEDVPEGSASIPMNITIKALNSGNTTLATVQLCNASNPNLGIVPIYRSKVTTVSGKMFGENASFNILVNEEEWENANNGKPIEF